MFSNAIKSDKTIICSQIITYLLKDQQDVINRIFIRFYILSCCKTYIIDMTNMVIYFLRISDIVIVLGIDHRKAWTEQNAPSSPTHPVLLATNEIGNKYKLYCHATNLSKLRTSKLTITSITTSLSFNIKNLEIKTIQLSSSLELDM